MGMIDTYDIQELISEGGTGKVYKAIDTNRGRLIAIKVLHAQFYERTEVIDQFLYEANLYLDLNHPNLVKLIDFSISPVPYIVMEYVDGQTLENIINNVTGPIMENRVLDIIRQLLAALSYMHSCQVLHLDIKPANIMIDTNRTVKLLDLGISRSINKQNPQKEVGTPFYMSPEQVSEELLTEKTDIYGVGMTMYKMLCGKLPFPHNIQQPDLFTKISIGDIPDLSKFYPAVSMKYETLVKKAIHVDPDKRFSSCNDFMEELIKLN